VVQEGQDRAVNRQALCLETDGVQTAMLEDGESPAGDCIVVKEARSEIEDVMCT
jgi:hypothetical protein